MALSGIALQVQRILRDNSRPPRSDRPDGGEKAPPAGVRELVREWRVNGQPAQRGIDWPRSRWVAAFPDRAPTFERLPDELDRAVVRSAVQRALARRDAVGAFLPCMAWGFGRVGYGPHRVSKMLEIGESHVEQKLSAVASAASSGRPLEAYTLLAGGSRLDGLGPAFGTKFIYFVDARGLILDRIIATSLATVGSVRVNPARWDPRTYASYLAIMERWAGQLGLRPDELEQVLFTARSRSAGNQWGQD